MPWNPDTRPTWNETAREKSRAAVQERIEKHTAKVWPYIQRFRAHGLKVPQIARALEALEIPSPGAETGVGQGWTTMGVRRIIKRREGKGK